MKKITKEEVSLLIALSIKGNLTTSEINSINLEEKEYVEKRVDGKRVIYRRGKNFPIEVRSFINYPRTSKRVVAYLIALDSEDKNFAKSIKESLELKSPIESFLVGYQNAVTWYSKRIVNEVVEKTNVKLKE